MFDIKTFLILFIAGLVHANAAIPQGVKWSEIYTAWPAGVEALPYYEQIVNCTGPYALCSYAQCRIISLGSKSEPAMAECGCYSYPSATGIDAVNLGSVPGMLSKPAKIANGKACGDGQRNNTCTKVNTAPICKSQAAKPRPTLYKGLFDIISTFNVYTWPLTNPTPGNVCPFGSYTNCYSAGCLNKQAFNGANATCYCPVINVKKGSKTLFFTGNSNSTCTGSKGFTVGSIVWNGLGIVQA